MRQVSVTFSGGDTVQQIRNKTIRAIDQALAQRKEAENQVLKVIKRGGFWLAGLTFTLGLIVGASC